jgi:hypothetical protein
LSSCLLAHVFGRCMVVHKTTQHTVLHVLVIQQKNMPNGLPNSILCLFTVAKQVRNMEA